MEGAESVTSSKPESLENLFYLLKSNKEITFILREYSNSDTSLYRYKKVKYKPRDVAFRK